MKMQMQQQMTLFPDPPRMWGREQRRKITRRRGGAEKSDGRGRHANSLAAHDALEHALTGRRAEIMAWLDVHGPATDRQIVEGLFYAGADMNMVRPRVTELLDAGLLAECGKVRDEATGMMVRRVGAAGVPPSAAAAAANP